MDGVELRGARDAGGDPPVAAHALEHPGGRAGLTLDLAVGRALRAAAEHDQRRQHAEQDGQDDEEVRRAEQDADHLDDRGDTTKTISMIQGRRGSFFASS